MNYEKFSLEVTFQIIPNLPSNNVAVKNNGPYHGKMRNRPSWKYAKEHDIAFWIGLDETSKLSCIKNISGGHMHEHEQNAAISVGRHFTNIWSQVGKMLQPCGEARAGIVGEMDSRKPRWDS
jgi:hypothetical protein